MPQVIESVSLQALQGRPWILEYAAPATAEFESSFIPVHSVALEGREKTQVI